MDECSMGFEDIWESETTTCAIETTEERSVRLENELESAASSCNTHMGARFNKRFNLD